MPRKTKTPSQKRAILLHKVTNVTLVGLGAVLGAYGLRYALQSTRRGRVWILNRVMHGPRGVTYTLTDTDLLWLGRALIGEVSSRASSWTSAETVRGGQGVAWAMAQNFMLIGGETNRPRFSSFTGLLQAYCQPINPKWARGGRYVLNRPSHMSDAFWRRSITENKLQRRARITGTQWDQLPFQVKQLVQQFAQGELPNPVPEMTDWAARGMFPGYQTRIGGNDFGVSRSRRLIQGD